MKEALLIFIKNPQLGKAKTRLAATLGKEKALKIYEHLLAHTRQVATDLKVERHLFYSHFVNLKDEWSNELFIKQLQHQSTDLGQKMFEAFNSFQNKGLKKALIIGSDCLELTAEVVEKGYLLLEKNDAVLGPAKDGGYYCIGFNLENLGSRSTEVLKTVFLNKDWSHENVAQDAIDSFLKHELLFTDLPVLSDVDIEADLIGKGLL